MKEERSASQYRLLIVGKSGGTNVGASLLRAAKKEGYNAKLMNMDRAFEGPWVQRAICWHLLGHRPPRLKKFSEEVVERVKEFRPDALITTGTAPLTASALQSIGAFGVARLNYSTDDPWNPNHKASWFLEALPHYDTVFTPRRANEDDFRRIGCRTVYLPFGYDASLFQPVSLSEKEREELHADVLFVGGADEERVDLLTPLAESEINFATYGDYWQEYEVTSSCARGHGSPKTICRATEAADIALCLVRRANRDGHVMRSLEIPAIGGCMLVEDTDEHRALFGPPGQRVCYFDSPGTLLEQTRQLLDRPGERDRMREAVHQHIVVEEDHTYRDRLRTMMEAANLE